MGHVFPYDAFDGRVRKGSTPVVTRKSALAAHRERRETGVLASYIFLLAMFHPITTFQDEGLKGSRGQHFLPGLSGGRVEKGS